MSQSSPTGERIRGETGPESFRSVMTITDLKKLQSLCFILGEFGLTLASRNDRIHVPPVGSVGVYEEAIKAGLHFLVDPFVKRVMGRFSLSLAQVVPISWHYIVGFMCLCMMIGVQPTMGLFWSCFVLKRHPSGEGWWYILLRSQQKIVLGVPSLIHGWKG